MHVNSKLSGFLKLLPELFRSSLQILILISFRLYNKSYMPTKEHRKTVAGGSPIHTFFLLLSGSSQGLLFHQRLQVPRGVQGHRDEWEPKLRTQRNKHPAQAPLRAAPLRPLRQYPDVKHIMRSHWEQLSSSPYGPRKVPA